jgi:hypothetical protein
VPVAGRKHLIAANRSIKAAGLDENGLDASLCEFLRDCARQLDAKGMDGVSARLISAFLSAQKDVARAAARKPAPKSPEPSSPGSATQMTGPVAVEESPLDRLRRKKTGTAG